jgi:hypothetical protein
MHLPQTLPERAIFPPQIASCIFRNLEHSCVFPQGKPLLLKVFPFLWWINREYRAGRSPLFSRKVEAAAAKNGAAVLFRTHFFRRQCQTTSCLPLLATFIIPPAWCYHAPPPVITGEAQRRIDAEAYSRPHPLHVAEIGGTWENSSPRSAMRGLTSNRDQRLRIRARARPALRALAVGRAFAAPRFAAFTWPLTFNACLTLALGADP